MLRRRNPRLHAERERASTRSALTGFDLYALDRSKARSSTSCANRPSSSAPAAWRKPGGFCITCATASKTRHDRPDRRLAGARYAGPAAGGRTPRWCASSAKNYHVNAQVEVLNGFSRSRRPGRTARLGAGDHQAAPPHLPGAWRRGGGAGLCRNTAHPGRIRAGGSAGPAPGLCDCVTSLVPEIFSRARSLRALLPLSPFFPPHFIGRLPDSDPRRFVV